ncbi:MAG: hypothetical protein J5711_01265 [Bacteroidales bacterium]|nr:hypothetical protein [Bacteroidales bacterium]
MKNPKYTKKKDWIWLISGLVVTALYLIFSTQLYELLYYNGEFSNEMYSENMYLVVAAYTSILVWAVAVLYYLVIDRFERWYHWLIALVVVLALSPTVTYFYCGNYFKDNDLDLLMIPLKNFNIINTVITLVMFCIACLSVKKLSSHCSTTPF